MACGTACSQNDSREGAEMPTRTKKGQGELSNENLAGAPRADGRFRQRGAEGDAAGDCASIGDRYARTRPARCTDQAGLLLRYARPSPATERRRGAGTTGSGAGRRHRREASSGRPGRPAGGTPPVGRHECRGRRDARELRLLGVDEGEGPQRAGTGGSSRQPSCPQALLEGAALLLPDVRPGRARGWTTCASSAPRSC